ncbi:hypothetical protein PENFLA_c052G03700 [Penicillium flavigenum]|uniref:Uncharacterized protein n=1 Tax=Penicillium flavigenum TaxID=254877 RepID=A0A1V6SGR3_9EURO|nr:hypothetical protein PENFLA_c052G03700 [Penicillium flavigenum]
MPVRLLGPEEEPFGQPTTLEAVQPGTAVKPSGPWASHLKKLNYTVAKQRSMLKTHTLLALNDMEPRRELMVRDNRDRTPSSFEHNIAQSARHVEAALGYVVGGLCDTPCTHCKREIGPFPHCVRVVGCTAIVTPDGQLLTDIKAAITAAEACFSANHDIMKDAEGSTRAKLENQAIALRSHITHLQELCSAIAAPVDEGRLKKRRRQTGQPRPNRTF